MSEERYSYIDFINNFWKIDGVEGFNPTETRVYFYLLYLFNLTFWQKTWIVCGDDRMKGIIPCSSATLRNARNKLKEIGLIEFQVGGKGHKVKTRYQILTPKSIPKLYPKSTPKLHPYNKIKTKNKTSSNEEEFLKISSTDKTDSNWEGLMQNHLKKYGCSEEECSLIAKLTNNGEIGHPVWKIVSEIRDSNGRINQPMKFLISRLKNL